VDLNEESVEITKLSLWLKSAVRGKKLETLDNNIKCGNSLIDDPAVAGDKAFNWNTEFADIMASGGFDVIVGNPPYIFSRELISDSEKNFYYSNYSNTQFKLNTYILFIEKITKIISRNGLASLIIPNNWLTIDKNSDLRYYLLSRNKYISLTDCGDKVFQDASVDTVILTTKQE